jgi:hypothetical protein
MNITGTNFLFSKKSLDIYMLITYISIWSMT